MTTDTRTSEQIVAEALCGRRYRPGTVGYLAKTDNPTDYRDARSVLAALRAAGRLVDEQKVRDSIARAALVAAGVVPVQGEPGEHFHAWSEIPCKPGHCRMGEPNDDRECDCEAGPGSGCNKWCASRATVPDAATGELRPDEMTAKEAIELVLKRPGMYGLVPKNEHRSMKAERDAALAAIERVRTIHMPFTHPQFPGDRVYCKGCAVAGRGEKSWPCETRVALDGAPEPAGLPVEGESK